MNKTIFWSSTEKPEGEIQLNGDLNKLEVTVTIISSGERVTFYLNLEQTDELANELDEWIFEVEK